MELPIYFDGRQTGTLTVRRRKDGGLCLDSLLEDPGRVVRLRVFGEREFYLGVPVPEGEAGTLRLVRRLSPGETRRFPRKPEFAGERTEDRPSPSEEPAEPPKRRVLWLGGRPYYF